MTLPRFKEIRKKLNMTQAQLSDYLINQKGVKLTRGTLAKYESGVIFPSDKTLTKLAKALNVSKYYLAGKGPQASDIDEKLLNLLQTKFFRVKDFTDPIHQFLKTYLSFKGDADKPFSFYKDSDGMVNKIMAQAHFPRAKEVDNFWKKEFSFLFNDSDFQSSLVGTTEQEFEKLTLKKLESQYGKDVDYRNFKILTDTVDTDSKSIKLTASQVINGQATKQDLLDEIEKTIHDLKWSSENFLKKK